LKIKIVDYRSDLYQNSLDLRDRVLRKPLGMNIRDEDLSDEQNQIHFLAIENKVVLGVVILMPNYGKKIGKLRQMATAKTIRGMGYGKALVLNLESYALQNDLNTIVLNARKEALGFYKNLGYVISSEAFLELGITHYQMRKSLD